MKNLFDYRFKDETIYIKNAFDNLPSWEDILNDLDLNIKDDTTSVKCLDNLGFVTHFGERISSVYSMLETIRQIRPNEPAYTAHVYISLLSISRTFGWHNDNTDVFYIQSQGSVKWDVQYRKDIHTYILEPGDLIYVPKYVYHNTTPLTPRVGISIGFT